MANLHRQAMAKVDTAWLRMESPTNLMMITGVIKLGEAVDFAAFKTVIEQRFLAFKRFRQRAVLNTRGWCWEDDPHFDLSAHVRLTALPGQAGQSELEALVSELASTPLDQTKPLWQFHWVENHQGGPVVIGRTHHCYADGMAMVQVLLSLTDVDRQASLQAVQSDRYVRRRQAESNLFERLAGTAKEGVDTLNQVSHKLAAEAGQWLRDPQQLLDRVQGAGELAADLLAELAAVMALSDDPVSQFKGPLGVRKQVAWAPPLCLDEVKAVGHAFGCTVNDVLIASMTAALHTYLLEIGDDPSSLTMRATVPVNLRPLEHARELGNHFGLVFLDLPIAETNPLARLYQVSASMTELKQSKQALMSLGLLAALGMAPAAFQKPALELFSRKASTVLTNVPGPQQPLFLAGAPVTEMMFWVPQNGSIGLGISIISYCGHVYCGLMSDHQRVPDPSLVCGHFNRAFSQLLHLAMLIGPQSGTVDAELADQIHDWIDGQPQPSD